MDKKFAVSIALGLALCMPLVASARTINITGGSLDCDSGILTDSLGATSTHSTDLCQGGGGPIVGTIMQAWGITDGNTPTVAAGDFVTDEMGVRYQCPAYPGFPRCYDLTHTAWYRAQMIAIAHQLKALGVSGGLFGAWINSVK